MKYTISEKECDPRSPCIDLNELSSYLIIPSKFINTHQRLKNKLEVHYSIFPTFFSHKQTYAKNPRKKLEFLGIIHPNGRIEELTIKSTAFVEDIFYIYVKRRTRKRVTLKNLPGGTDEKENTQLAVSHRVIQQRLTFKELCGRNTTGTVRI